MVPLTLLSVLVLVHFLCHLSIENSHALVILVVRALDVPPRLVPVELFLEPLRKACCAAFFVGEFVVCFGLPRER